MHAKRVGSRGTTRGRTFLPDFALERVLPMEPWYFLDLGVFAHVQLEKPNMLCRPDPLTCIATYRRGAPAMLKIGAGSTATYLHYPSYYLLPLTPSPWPYPTVYEQYGGSTSNTYSIPQRCIRIAVQRARCSASAFTVYRPPVRLPPMPRLAGDAGLFK